MAKFANRQASTYSTSYKKVLNIAMAMIGQPDLIVLDEPTIGLDWDSRHAIYDAMRSGQNRGQSIIFSSNK